MDKPKSRDELLALTPEEIEKQKAVQAALDAAKPLYDAVNEANKAIGVDLPFEELHPTAHFDERGRESDSVPRAKTRPLPSKRRAHEEGTTCPPIVLPGARRAEESSRRPTGARASCFQRRAECRGTARCLARGVLGRAPPEDRRPCERCSR